MGIWRNQLISELQSADYLCANRFVCQFVRSHIYSLTYLLISDDHVFGGTFLLYCTVRKLLRPLEILKRFIGLFAFQMITSFIPSLLVLLLYSCPWCSVKRMSWKPEKGHVPTTKSTTSAIWATLNWAEFQFCKRYTMMTDWRLQLDFFLRGDLLFGNLIHSLTLLITPCNQFDSARKGHRPTLPWRKRKTTPWLCYKLNEWTDGWMEGWMDM